MGLPNFRNKNDELVATGQRVTDDKYNLAVVLSELSDPNQYRQEKLADQCNPRLTDD